MQAEPIPIETFVATTLVSPKFAKIMSGWRVEHKKIEVILLGIFREMGIYAVPHEQRKLVTDTIAFQLIHSKEITKMVNAAKREELSRRSNRHAE